MTSLMFIISVSVLLTLCIVLVLVQLTRISKNKPVEYEGELEGFPENVVNAMLDEQERQGNPRDVTVFENNKSSPAFNKGFDWADSLKGYDLWKAIINDRKFYLLD